MNDRPVETLKRVIYNAPIQTFLAKVKAVDSGAKTCTVEDLEGLERFDVRLSSKPENGDALFFPVVGSDVLCGILENNETACYIIMYSEIDSILFHGGNNGGIVKVQELKTQLQKITLFLDTFQTLLSTPIMEPGNGSPSAFQAALNLSLSTMQMPDYSSIENTKIKH